MERSPHSREREEHQRKWLGERRLSSDHWWRCSRCLIRVYVKDKGWECPQCKTPYEPSITEDRSKVQRSDEGPRCLMDGKEYSAMDCTQHCLACSGNFSNAQDFYDHLDDCRLGVVQREALRVLGDPKSDVSSSQQSERRASKVEVVTEKNEIDDVSTFWTSK